MICHIFPRRITFTTYDSVARGIRATAEETQPSILRINSHIRKQLSPRYKRFEGEYRRTNETRYCTTLYIDFSADEIYFAGCDRQVLAHYFEDYFPLMKSVIIDLTFNYLDIWDFSQRVRVIFLLDKEDDEKEIYERYEQVRTAHKEIPPLCEVSFICIGQQDWGSKTIYFPIQDYEQEDGPICKKAEALK
jgi:hypothetical protein